MTKTLFGELDRRVMVGYDPNTLHLSIKTSKNKMCVNLCADICLKLKVAKG